MPSADAPLSPSIFTHTLFQLDTHFDSDPVATSHPVDVVDRRVHPIGPSVVGNPSQYLIHYNFSKRGALR